MKITIDTKEDTAEEIKRVISMLSSMVESPDIIADASRINEAEGIQMESKQDYVEDGIFSIFSNNHEEQAPSASPETGMGSEVDGLLNSNRVEYVDVPEPKVVEKMDSDSVVVY